MVDKVNSVVRSGLPSSLVLFSRNLNFSIVL